MSDLTREQAKQMVRDAAFDTGQECPTCHGHGKVPGGKKAIHAMSGLLGADWDADDVCDLIDRADNVRFVNGFAGNGLAVFADGRTRFFQVSRPDTQDGGDQA